MAVVIGTAGYAGNATVALSGAVPNYVPPGEPMALFARCSSACTLNIFRAGPTGNVLRRAIPITPGTEETEIRMNAYGFTHSFTVTNTDNTPGSFTLEAF